MVRSAVTEVKIHQALVGQARLAGQTAEILNGRFIKADSDLPLEGLRMGCRRLQKPVIFTFRLCRGGYQEFPLDRRRRQKTLVGQRLPCVPRQMS